MLRAYDVNTYSQSESNNRHEKPPTTRSQFSTHTHTHDISLAQKHSQHSTHTFSNTKTLKTSWSAAAAAAKLQAELHSVQYIRDTAPASYEARSSERERVIVEIALGMCRVNVAARHWALIFYRNHTHRCWYEINSGFYFFVMLRPNEQLA